MKELSDSFMHILFCEAIFLLIRVPVITGMVRWKLTYLSGLTGSKNPTKT